MELASYLTGSAGVTTRPARTAAGRGCSRCQRLHLRCRPGAAGWADPVGDRADWRGSAHRRADRAAVREDGAAGGGSRAAADHGSLRAGVRARAGGPRRPAGWSARGAAGRRWRNLRTPRSRPAASPVISRSSRRPFAGMRRPPPSTPWCGDHASVHPAARPDAP